MKLYLSILLLLSTFEGYLSAMTPKKVLMIGAAGQRGQQFFSKFLNSDDFKVSGFVLRKTLPSNILEYAKDGEIHFDIDSALNSQEYDLAVITTIHKGKDELLEKLVSKGIQVLKEKPLMVEEGSKDRITHLLNSRGSKAVLVSAHRPYLKSFALARAHLDLLGGIEGFDYTFNFALPSPTSGWRAKKDLAKGGVLLDMGYHAIDALLSFFPTIRLDDAVFDFRYPETLEEGLEDEAHLSFSDQNGYFGALHLNRHAAEKAEILKIFGRQYNMEVQAKEARIIDFDGNVIRRFNSDSVDKIDPFINALTHPEHWNWEESTNRAIKTNQIIFDAYQDGVWLNNKAKDSQAG